MKKNNLRRTFIYDEVARSSLDRAIDFVHRDKQTKAHRKRESILRWHDATVKNIEFFRLRKRETARVTKPEDTPERISVAAEAYRFPLIFSRKIVPILWKSSRPERKIVRVFRVDFLSQLFITILGNLFFPARQFHGICGTEYFNTTRIEYWFYNYWRV